MVHPLRVARGYRLEDGGGVEVLRLEPPRLAVGIALFEEREAVGDPLDASGVVRPLTPRFGSSPAGLPNWLTRYAPMAVSAGCSALSIGIDVTVHV